MRPIYVEMTAFGSYQDTTKVDFSRVKGGKFVIYGDTGAGKTLIFDAITFALFGECSGTDRKFEMMHNSKTDKSKDSVVTLKFLHDGKEYTVTRTIHYAKKRGTQNEFGAPKCSVILTGPDGKLIENPDSEIVKMLGLNNKQFRQIVMLAQGEFKEFLKSEDKTKAEILGRLIDNSDYLRYQQLYAIALKKVSDDRVDSVKKIRNLMETFKLPDESCNFSEEAWLSDNPELISNLDKLVLLEEEEKQKIELVREEKNSVCLKLTEKKGHAIEQNNNIRDLEKSGEKLSELAGQKEQKEKYKKNAELVDKVSSVVVPAAEKLAEKNEELNQLINLIDSNLKEIEGLEKRKAEADSLVKGDEQIKKDAEDLKGKTVGLKNMLPDYDEFIRLKDAIKERENKIDEVGGQLQSKNAEYEELNKKYEENKKEKETLNDADSGITKADSILKELIRKKDEIVKENGLQNSVFNVKKQEEELGNRKEKYQEIHNRTLKKKEEYDLKYALFLQGQSGILASETRKKLEETGETLCPVCGTHLVKGTDIHFALCDEIVPTQNEVENVRKAWDESEKERADLANKNGILEAEINTQKINLVNQAMNLFADCSGWDSLSDENYLSNKIIELETEIAAEQKKRDEFVLQKNRYLQLAEIIPQEEKKLNELRGLTERLKQSKSEKEKEIETRKKEADEFSKKLSFESKEAVQAQIRVYEAKAEELDGIIKKHIHDQGEITELYSKKSGELKANQEKKPSMEDKVKQLKDELDQALTATGFESAEVAKNDMQAVLDEMSPVFNPRIPVKEWIKQVQENINDYYKTYSSLEDRIKELEEKTKGLQIIDTVALDEQINSAKNEYEQINKKVSEMSTLLQGHMDLRDAVSTEKGKIQKSDYAWKMLYELSDLANGSSNQQGGKMDFNRYILGAVFKDVLEHANARLETMFNEYQLAHKAEGKNMNQIAGLDVEILEKNEPRNKSTLSGGEGFVVSLVLALGLSDYVQSHMGGKKIETLFIDEGFGTLDDDLLDKTMKAIKNLSDDGNCLVGMISHVESVEDAFGEKIHVIKGDHGSRVEYVGM